MVSTNAFQISSLLMILVAGASASDFLFDEDIANYTDIDIYELLKHQINTQL